MVGSRDREERYQPCHHGVHHGGNADISGHIWPDREDLVRRRPPGCVSLRGSKKAMIFQGPLSWLHPYCTVGSEIAEAYLIHNKVIRTEAKTHAVDMLRRVGIPPGAPVGEHITDAVAADSGA
jgi:peptide/nickel transport system ATP-binding protein